MFQLNYFFFISRPDHLVTTRPVISYPSSNLSNPAKMYICSACSFSTSIRRNWDRHYNKFKHKLQEAFDEDEDLDESLERFSTVDTSQLEDSYEDENNADIELNAALCDQPSPDHHPESDDGDDPDDDQPWYPWKSRVHYYLTVLYHGSHRRLVLLFKDLQLFSMFSETLTNRH